MKRLTIRNSDGSVSQPLYTTVADVFFRLAAYEDTGLEPEELKSIFPVPIGSTVYVMETCRCGPGYAERCQSGKTANAEKRKKAVETRYLGINRRCVNCVKLFERPFNLSHIGKVGKTVFATREEAEKAMEGANTSG